jgi:hypothetical protein
MFPHVTRHGWSTWPALRTRLVPAGPATIGSDDSDYNVTEKKGNKFNNLKKSLGQSGDRFIM